MQTLTTQNITGQNITGQNITGQNITAQTNAFQSALLVRPSASGPSMLSQRGRTLAHRWDLIGVVSLMLSSGVYGVYALTCLTGF